MSSPRMATCQLLIDPPASGAWNMALDEVLLNAAADDGLPTLRFYQWQRPTLSLGYFQNTANRSSHPSRFDADVVRRLSGGGAILHDLELTYSLILPASHKLSRDTQWLYDVVHQNIRKTLDEFLAAAHSSWRVERCDQPSEIDTKDEPFLCFQRRSTGDLLLGKRAVGLPAVEQKIVGSAQRRRRGAVLQHGSILLGRSTVTPELNGIAEITHVKISPADLLTRLPDCLAENLSINLTESALPERFTHQILELQKTKYDCASWTLRR